jgi:hypothetical protein
MSKSLTKAEKLKENIRWHCMRELKTANERLGEITERHPEIQQLVQTLLLMGGDTVEFEGWTTPENLESFAHIGKSMSPDEVSTAMARNEECPNGMCFANVAELVNRDLQPAFAFILADRYGIYSYWAEHFILKHIPTGTYHESTVTAVPVQWYFVVDLTMEWFEELGDNDSGWLSG